MTDNKRPPDVSMEQSVKELIKLGQCPYTQDMVNELILEFNSDIEAAKGNIKNWPVTPPFVLRGTIHKINLLVGLLEDFQSTINFKLDAQNHETRHKLEDFYKKMTANSGHKRGRKLDPSLSIGTFADKISPGGNGEPWEDV